MIRGFQISNGPQTGYRYDGIYFINHIKRVIGKSGYLVCRFHLQSERLIESLEKILADKLKSNYRRTNRKKVSVSKVERNIQTSDKINELYKFCCQICDCLLEKPGGAIAVGAHVRGLGRPHDGPDDISNIICLCPNHHAQFDAFSFYIDAESLEIINLAGFERKTLNLSKKHKINIEFFEYNKKLYENAKHL